MTSHKKSVQAYALLFAVLLLGVVSGAGATYAYLRRQTGLSVGRDPSRMRREHLDALTRELQLSGAQRASIEGILQANSAEREQRMRAMYETCGGPMVEHKRRVDAAIREVLRAEQQARFDELAAEQNRKFFGPPGEKAQEGR